MWVEISWVSFSRAVGTKCKSTLRTYSTQKKCKSVFYLHLAPLGPGHTSHKNLSNHLL